MANFLTSIAYVLKNEGGYVNNPADHGGETNFGLTARTARGLGYTGDMADMTYDQAVALWKKGFWDPWKMDQIQNQAVATAILDLHANGSVSATRIIQQSLVDLGWDGVQDGLWGPATRAGVNAANPSDLIQALADNDAAFFEQAAQGEDQEQFENGWLARAKRMADLAVDAVVNNPGSSALIALIIIGGVVLTSSSRRG